MDTECREQYRQEQAMLDKLKKSFYPIIAWEIGQAVAPEINHLRARNIREMTCPVCKQHGKVIVVNAIPLYCLRCNLVLALELRGIRP